MTESAEHEEEEVAQLWLRRGVPVGDPLRPLGYLYSRLRDEYLVVMAVLEDSVVDMTPHEVACRLAQGGIALPEAVVAVRLRSLHRTYEAVLPQPDSEVSRYEELNGSKWRYAATPLGRQVQRFWAQLAKVGAVQREVPVSALDRMVTALEELSQGPTGRTAEVVDGLFSDHEHLDSALVGQADLLSALARRFDLDADGAAELKSLLVGYATHVAWSLDRAVARIHAGLMALRPSFGALAEAARSASRAGRLIDRGLMAASRGSRTEDWEQLLSWFSPSSGRAARFAQQLVRAVPVMHSNLQRLHGAGGSTFRARALSLAVACRDPVHGGEVLTAALGDRAWRKLHTIAPGEDNSAPSWHDGPKVGVARLLRQTGRSQPRGGVAAAPRREAAAALWAERRAVRQAERRRVVEEVLSGKRPLSDTAVRAALRAAVAAAQVPARQGRRTGEWDGLACTLVTAGRSTTGVVEGVSWRIVLPGRLAFFHPPGQLPCDLPAPAQADAGDRVTLQVVR